MSIHVSISLLKQQLRFYDKCVGRDMFYALPAAKNGQQINNWRLVYSFIRNGKETACVYQITIDAAVQLLAYFFEFEVDHGHSKWIIYLKFFYKDFHLKNEWFEFDGQIASLQWNAVQWKLKCGGRKFKIEIANEFLNFVCLRLLMSVLQSRFTEPSDFGNSASRLLP